MTHCTLGSIVTEITVNNVQYWIGPRGMLVPMSVSSVGHVVRQPHFDEEDATIPELDSSGTPKKDKKDRIIMIPNPVFGKCTYEHCENENWNESLSDDEYFSKYCTKNGEHWIFNSGSSHSTVNDDDDDAEWMRFCAEQVST